LMSLALQVLWYYYRKPTWIKTSNLKIIDLHKKHMVEYEEWKSKYVVTDETNRAQQLMKAGHFLAEVYTYHLEYQKEARKAQTKGVICKAFNRQITQEEGLFYEKFRQQFPRIFYPKFQFLNADFSGIEDCRLYNLYNYWK